jgi:hypothetical protein
MTTQNDITDTIAPPKPSYTALRALAAQFVARAEAQGMKGAARDRAAIEFFCGAVAGQVALQGEHDDTAQHWLRVTALLITTRGYSEVANIARGSPK